MNRTAFFDALRPHVNLTRENVAGAERILDYALTKAAISSNPDEAFLSREDFAYALATAWWETGQRLQPITEYGSRKYLSGKKYWPFIGRGLIQVTWDYNYRKAAQSLGLPINTFIDEPDLLLEWDYALPLLFKGMATGMYTGKSLGDYIDDVDESDEEDLREYIAARRIVNGTDKARKIGQLALHFEHALKDAGYEHVPADEIIEAAKIEPPMEPPQPRREVRYLGGPPKFKRPPTGFIGALLAILRLFRR